ncbi:hypothetical protein NIES2107_66400 [Nostoc carneum NIES-2107]|nr:hypothetical protein NIES2107_66400 [Nostoc carneum NIES-2107]
MQPEVRNWGQGEITMLMTNDQLPITNYQLPSLRKLIQKSKIELLYCVEMLHRSSNLSY